jgi:hypothetical protein
VKPKKAEFCCEDMTGVVTQDPDDKDHTFFVEDRVLRMVVRRATLADGSLFFHERAVMHCPFCGTQLETELSLASKLRH